MAEYIDREKLRQKMYQEAFVKDSDLQRWDSGCWIRYKLFENVLEKIEVADVQPVKHGKWICHDDELLGFTRECSVCHIEGCLDGYYCPICGAKMDGDKNG